MNFSKCINKIVLTIVLILSSRTIHTQEEHLKTGAKLLAGVPIAGALIPVEAVCRKFKNGPGILYTAGPLNTATEVEHLAITERLFAPDGQTIVEDLHLYEDKRLPLPIRRQKLFYYHLPKTFKRYAFYRNLAAIYCAAGVYYIGRGIYGAVIKKEQYVQ